MFLGKHLVNFTMPYLNLPCLVFVCPGFTLAKKKLIMVDPGRAKQQVVSSIGECFHELLDY